MRTRGRSPHHAPRQAPRALFATVVAALSLVVSLLAAPPAIAAPVSGFDPGNIISDDLFYDGDAMSSAQIQRFLDDKIGECENGKCLNVVSAGVSSRSAWYSEVTGDLVCSEIRGGTMAASELIYRVQNACGISAKVILVMLQKEQRLVTNSAPLDRELRAAMGASCPDNAPCDPAYAGLGPQIVKGAQQLKIYKAGRFGKQPGRHFIPFDTDASCGGSYVNVQNYATAALYNYTPYQPNAASLAAGFGTGDKCSSYGNRNFYNYYTRWFGADQPTDICAEPADSAIVPAGGEYVTTEVLNARSAPTTACANIITQLDVGTAVVREATYGVWWRVRTDTGRYWVHSDYLATAPAPPYSAQRIAGVDRYSTAVEVSRRAYPQGAATVLLASGADYPDALAAGAAAGSAGASLLLTEAAGLPSAVSAELQRLRPTQVYLIGGEDRISAEVRAQVAALVPGAGIERIAGGDRYETSRLIAARFFPSAGTAYVATGRNFADATVAAALGGLRKAPVILVDGALSTLDGTAAAQLSSIGARNVIIAGTEPAVSGGIEAELRRSGFSVTRVGGVDRFQTSLLLNADAFPGGTPTALFATGYNFPDALTGAVLAARSGSPLYTTLTTCMVSAVKDRLIASNAREITLIGGEPSLSDDVLRSVRC